MIRKWALLFTALAVSVSTAQAQTWPTRTIRLVAPSAPGGIADIAARLVGQKLSEALGQRAIRDHRRSRHQPGGVQEGALRCRQGPRADHHAERHADRARHPWRLAL